MSVNSCSHMESGKAKVGRLNPLFEEEFEAYEKSDKKKRKSKAIQIKHA